MVDDNNTMSDVPVTANGHANGDELESRLRRGAFRALVQDFGPIWFV